MADIVLLGEDGTSRSFQIPEQHSGAVVDLFEKGISDEVFYERLKIMLRGENPNDINLIVKRWINKWEKYYRVRWDYHLEITDDQKQKIISEMLKPGSLPGLIIMAPKEIVTAKSAFDNLGKDSHRFKGIDKAIFTSEENQEISLNDRRNGGIYFLLHENTETASSYFSTLSPEGRKIALLYTPTMRVVEYLILWDFKRFIENKMIDIDHEVICPESSILDKGNRKTVGIVIYSNFLHKFVLGYELTEIADTCHIFRRVEVII